jgi:hypothetical protein
MGELAPESALALEASDMLSSLILVCSGRSSGGAGRARPWCRASTLVVMAPVDLEKGSSIGVVPLRDGGESKEKEAARMRTRGEGVRGGGTNADMDMVWGRLVTSQYDTMDERGG